MSQRYQEEPVARRQSRFPSGNYDERFRLLDRIQIVGFQMLHTAMLTDTTRITAD